jgi:acylglycerol lipase
VPSHVTIPALLMLAGQERIVNNAPTRRFVESFASPDRTILEYPEAHHTLEFEPQPHRSLDDLLGWLNRHV